MCFFKYAFSHSQVRQSTKSNAMVFFFLACCLSLSQLCFATDVVKGILLHFVLSEKVLKYLKNAFALGNFCTNNAKQQMFQKSTKQELLWTLHEKVAELTIVIFFPFAANTHNHQFDNWLCSFNYFNKLPVFSVSFLF